MALELGIPSTPYWERLRKFFEELPTAEVERRVASARRMIKENGVTYNLYDDAQGMARPWELDIVPFVVGSAEWGLVEAAVKQRARVADALLRDIYGSQRLIAEGAIPPHLVYGHPQYLRALQGIEPPGGVRVHLFAADLARGADGSWTVLGSRVDAPGGVGYALENRIVIGQTLPELFIDLGVQRLASFFADYRDAVLGLAQGMKGRAALLTPGTYNEAYFEHAFLARYLGLELFEGEDLAARDGQLFVRTTGGLARTAVLFRRLDSDFCDPVELRADSALGIPGLVDAIRNGGAVVANALGGGVVESPAMNAYLPAVARFFGEELLVPDIATIWCGTQWGREAALARLANLVVRDAFDARPLFWRGTSARLGRDFSLDEIGALADHLERRGATTVVQELPPLGEAPSFENGTFITRPLAIRVFAAWTPNGYVVMPGGLARVAADHSIRALSMQSGAASKDLWVLASGQVDMFSLLRPEHAAVEVRRSSDEAPSRAMDNLFWLGRYIERTESFVRVLRRSNTIDAIAPELELTLRLLGLFRREANAETLSLLLSNVVRTAWSVRDRLSVDTWRAVEALTSESNYDELINRTAAISGLAAENMTRGSNWLFFDLGRRIERATLSCDLAREIFTPPSSREAERVQIALEIADSAMTYRSRYLNAFQVAPALDLLLLDGSNPRATAFQLTAIVHHVSALPEETGVQRRRGARVIASQALTTCMTADAKGLAALDGHGRRKVLETFVAGISTSMELLSDAIGVAYFHHATRDASNAAARDSS